MAVELTGTPVHHTANSDGSFAVTIPSDAEICIVSVAGYNSQSSLVDELNWNNGATLDFTLIARGTYNGTQAETEALYMQSSDGNWPGPGAQTLYFSNTGSYSEGFHFYVHFYKGISTSDPIGDSEIGANGNTNTSPQTSSLTGVTADDMCIGATYSYNAVPDMDPTGYGQTSMLEAARYNSCHLGVGRELGESAFRIESIDWGPPVWFAINAASGSYILTAESGSFILSGTIASLLKSSKITAESGSYALSGQSAAALYNRKIAAESGAFALSGQAAGLLHNRAIQAESGTYSISGTDAGLLKSFAIDAGPGAFTLTGADAALLVNRLISADPGAYTLTGMDATLIYSSGYVITAESGAYTLIGADAALLISRLIQAAGGSYALSGTAAGLLKSNKIAANNGSYALTGQAAGLLFGRKVSAESGAYALTGQSAALLFGRKLSAESGGYILTGIDADLLRSFLLEAESASYILTGFDATLQYSGESLPHGLVTISIAMIQPGFSISAKQPRIRIQ